MKIVQIIISNATTNVLSLYRSISFGKPGICIGPGEHYAIKNIS